MPVFFSFLAKNKQLISRTFKIKPIKQKICSEYGFYNDLGELGKSLWT